MKHLGPIALAILSLTTTQALANTQAGHYQGDRLAKQAKIAIAQAEQMALTARPGVVTDRELEREKGGSGLRYSFDIKAQNVTYEVGIDAKTGAVLENAPEGKNPD